ncbi:hypothetical protein M5D96_010155, partial [Drosophila gunungcola]
LGSKLSIPLCLSLSFWLTLRFGCVTSQSLFGLPYLVAAREVDFYFQYFSSWRLAAFYATTRFLPFVVFSDQWSSDSHGRLFNLKNRLESRQCFT